MSKIIFDARRKLNSGIGRVSQWIIENVLKNNELHDVYYLASELTKEQYSLPIEKTIICNYKSFSVEDVYEIPKIVLENKADIFFSPQFNCSPFHLCKTINIIHDLWYILNPEFVPTLKDIEFRFENYNNCLVEIGNWLDDDKQQLLLKPYGINLLAQSTSPIHKYLWSQIAMIATFSSKLVFVNHSLLKEFNKIFKRNTNLSVIENGYNTNITNIKANKQKQHFLCLAKLERRKKIEYLIKEYCIYFKSSKVQYKLIIAGDVGYKKYSENILAQITSLKKEGYPIEFIAGVNDSQMKDLFALTRAIVVTSDYESFGLPAIEALAGGIDLIATKTGKIKTGFDKFVSFISEENSLSSYLIACDNQNRLKPKVSKNELNEKVNNLEIETKWISLLRM